MASRSGSVRADLEFRQPSLAVSLFLAGVMVLVLDLGLVVPDSAGADGWETGLQIGVTAVAVLAALSIWQVRIWADPTALRARSYWGRQRRIEWSQVTRFDARGQWLGVWTTDGRRVRLLQYGSAARSAREMVDRLESYKVDRHRELGLR